MSGDVNIGVSVLVRAAFVVGLLMGVTGESLARQETIELGGSGWVPVSDALMETDPLEPADREVFRTARRHLAEGRPNLALREISPWLRANEFTRNPGLPGALLIRGDALAATSREWRALYDYERLLKEFPGSAEFPIANEREYAIAERYLDGLKRKFLGLRIIDAEDIAVELLIRIQERMPGSQLAERAAIRLADHFYDKREIDLAAEMYTIYLENFPAGPHRLRAEKRRIYTSLAKFKGPAYDASSLLDARLAIESFERRYPLEAQRTGLNEGLIARIDESQAAQMLDSAEWYLQTKNFPAARLTLGRLILAHPQTAAADRAREFMASRGWTPPRAAGPESDPGVAGDEGGIDVEGPIDAEPIGTEPSGGERDGPDGSGASERASRGVRP